LDHHLVGLSFDEIIPQCDGEMDRQTDRQSVIYLSLRPAAMTCSKYSVLSHKDITIKMAATYNSTYTDLLVYSQSVICQLFK